MRFALTFPVGCPFKNTAVYVTALNDMNARIYAKAMFGHLWAGIYDAETFDHSNLSYLINAETTAEEGIRRACNNGWITSDAVPKSIWEHEGEDE